MYIALLKYLAYKTELKLYIYNFKQELSITIKNYKSLFKASHLTLTTPTLLSIFSQYIIKWDQNNINIYIICFHDFTKVLS